MGVARFVVQIPVSTRVYGCGADGGGGGTCGGGGAAGGAGGDKGGEGGAEPMQRHLSFMLQSIVLALSELYHNV